MQLYFNNRMVHIQPLLFDLGDRSVDSCLGDEHTHSDIKAERGKRKKKFISAFFFIAWLNIDMCKNESEEFVCLYSVSHSW